MSLVQHCWNCQTKYDVTQDRCPTCGAPAPPRCDKPVPLWRLYLALGGYLALAGVGILELVGLWS